MQNMAAESQSAFPLPPIRPQYEVPASVKEFRENLIFFGSKISTILTGAETYPQWESQLKRKARGLAAIDVLEGCSDGMNARLYELVNIALQELILASLSLNLRAELEDKSANEAYSILSARYSNSGVAAYTTLAVRLCLLRQTPEQSISDYIAKFDSLRAQFETSGGEIGLKMQIGIFVAGLQPSYSREAFLELARQGNDPDFEGLKQALIRVSIFEANQREFRH